MRSLWAAGLLLRRIPSELGMILLLFFVIATTSFLFAAAPRMFNRVSDDGLRYAARSAPRLSGIWRWGSSTASRWAAGAVSRRCAPTATSSRATSLPRSPR